MPSGARDGFSLDWNICNGPIQSFISQPLSVSMYQQSVGLKYAR